MSSAFDCCLPCPPGSIPSANTVNIPGPQGDKGDPGADGANGTDGHNAFSTTLGSGTLIPAPGNSVSVPVDDASWMQVNQYVFMSGDEGVANFQVISKNDVTNFALLKFLAYEGDIASGLTISAGAGVSPSGVQRGLFVTRFTSQEYAIAVGIIGNVAHNLGSLPEIVRAYLVSQDGSEGGYSAGDVVDPAFVYHYQDISEGRGNAFEWGASNTNVWGTYCLGIVGFDGPIMAQKTIGSVFRPTLTDDTKWKLKLVAVKLNTP